MNCSEARPSLPGNWTKNFDSTLNISGKHSVSFEKCMFDNQNENENKDFVSFISRCDSIKICECSFTTKNRTALNFKEEIPSLEVVNCYFENCGNDKTNFIKSAVIINKYSAFVFQNTVFKDNVSKYDYGIDETISLVGIYDTKEEAIIVIAGIKRVPLNSEITDGSSIL